jgi:hypothetical protein
MEKLSISKDRLKQLVIEENKKLLKEGIDHTSIKEIVSGASQLLGAIEKFMGKASPMMQSSLEDHINPLKKKLENMISNPGSYVLKPRVKKKVSLKPAKGGQDETLTSK